MDTAIIMLHSVGDPALPSNVSTDELRRLIEGIREEREIRRLPAAVESNKKTAALTFDDGYANFHSHALPVLEQYDVPATAFLPLDLCIGNWPDRPGEVFDTHRDDFLLDSDAIHVLARHDLVTLGNHSLSHPRLTKTGEDPDAFTLNVEVNGCHRTFEELFERSPTQFSYPFGAYGPRVISEVVDEHEYAVTAEEGLVSDDPDRLRLPRIRGEDVDAALDAI